jgi:hypothetical protein
MGERVRQEVSRCVVGTLAGLKYGNNLRPGCQTEPMGGSGKESQPVSWRSHSAAARTRTCTATRTPKWRNTAARTWNTPGAPLPRARGRVEEHLAWGLGPLPPLSNLPGARPLGRACHSRRAPGGVIGAVQRLQTAPCRCLALARGLPAKKGRREKRDAIALTAGRDGPGS